MEQNYVTIDDLNVLVALIIVFFISCVILFIHLDKRIRSLEKQIKNKSNFTGKYRATSWEK